MTLIEGWHHLATAALFGVVQGATEFLPISSSGHLLLLHSIIDAENVNAQTFDVALHVGTLLALIIYFWRDLGRLIISAGQWLRRPAEPTSDQRLVGYLLVSAVPAGVLGLLFESFFETAVRSVSVVAVTLIVAGLALWLVDRFVSRHDDLNHLSWAKALIIGFGQAAALVPGVSRSGASMTIGRLLGLGRQAAARFSFLMAIPIIAGAATKKGWELWSSPPVAAELWDMAVGLLVSLLMGLLAIRVLLRFVSRHSYAAFAMYRLALGAVLLVLSLT